MSDNMTNSKFDYSPEKLAGEYGLSIEQARRHISRFGPHAWSSTAFWHRQAERCSIARKTLRERRTR